jgi:hypothetical protein
MWSVTHCARWFLQAIIGGSGNKGRETFALRSCYHALFAQHAKIVVAISVRLSGPPRFNRTDFDGFRDVNCIILGPLHILFFFPAIYNITRPPLWSSGQSCWLQMQRSGFDSRRRQIFWEVVGLDRGPLSIVSTLEELLGRNSSGFVLESRENVRRDPSL